MNRKYFTLVEVLVVIGIISVLAGLLIPAVGMARQAGRRTECVSNQGQLAKLLIVSMQSDDNYLVSGGSYGGTDTATDPAWTVYLRSKNRLTNLKGFRCPALPTMENPDLAQSSPTNQQLQSALGVVASKEKEGGNTRNGFDFRGTKRLTVGTGASAYRISPNQLVIGGCSGWINGSDMLVPRANLLAGGSKGLFYIVHGDQFNVFHLDGHVESVDKETATKLKYVPDPDAQKAVTLKDGNIKDYEDAD